MRHFVLMIVFVVPGILANAQYRKTRQDRRTGKTYGVTARASFITQSDCLQPALAYSFGKDRNESRFFNWHDLEVILPSTFKYNTTGYSYNSGTGQETMVPTQVRVKAVMGFAYRYNHAYYLIDNSNEDNKVLPFIYLGISSLVHFGTGDHITTPPDQYNLEKYPAEEPNLTFGFNGGVGVLFRLSNRFGIKATGGYSLQTKSIDFESIGELESENNNYFHYKSHPYATVGLRFRISGD